MACLTRALPNACWDLNEFVILFYSRALHVAFARSIYILCFSLIAILTAIPRLISSTNETLNCKLLFMATNDFKTSLVSLDRKCSRKYCPPVVISIHMKNVSNCYLLPALGLTVRISKQSKCNNITNKYVYSIFI